MIIGKLRHRITLQQYKRVNNGGFNETIWVDVAKVWGEFQGVSGDAIIASNAEKMMTNWKVIIRYRDMEGITRLLHNGKKYTIEAVLPDNNQRMITLLCKAGLND